MVRFLTAKIGILHIVREVVPKRSSRLLPGLLEIDTKTPKKIAYHLARNTGCSGTTLDSS